MSYAEEAMGAQALRLLGVRHKESLNVRDLLQLVRGYEKSKNRVTDTAAAARKIALWREDVGFPRILQATLDRRLHFHTLWSEAIYGEDRYGHPLIGLTVTAIDADAIQALPPALLERLVAQKLAGYRSYVCRVPFPSSLSTFRLYHVW